VLLQPVAVDEPADQNIVASFGYVLALTALTAGEPISLLDWGGGLGHYRLYAKALLPRVAIDYHCVDLPGIAAAGRTLQPDAQFHTSAREIGDRAFDLVVCSSALHYAQDWPATLALLAKATTRFLYVARLQTVDRATDERFHRLLSAFRDLTGVPVLLNTSFNVRGQPIVETPDEAVSTFQQTGIDALVLGEHLIAKRQ